MPRISKSDLLTLRNRVARLHRLVELDAPIVIIRDEDRRVVDTLNQIIEKAYRCCSLATGAQAQTRPQPDATPAQSESR